MISRLGEEENKTQNRIWNIRNFFWVIFIFILCNYFLKPVIDWFSNKTLFLITTFYSKYIDYLLVKAVQDEYSVELLTYSWLVFGIFTIIYTIIVSSVFGYLGVRRKVYPPKEDSKNQFNPEKALKKLKKTLIALWILSAVGIVGIFFEYWRTSFCFSARTTVLFNMEAIAPFISDVEEKSLKSALTQVKSKTNYLELEKKIEKIANSNGLILKVSIFD